MSDEPKSFVSRSEYQKVCEENKRLKRDLRMILEEPLTRKSQQIRLEYHEEYKKQRELVNELSLMVGSKKKTKDGYNLLLSEKVFIPELVEELDNFKYAPVEYTLINAMNNNEKDLFAIKDNCEAYCKELNDICDELDD